MANNNIVALLGKSCAGKNLAAAFLVGYGYREIDVDKIGHQQIDAHSEQIGKLFPQLGKSFSRNELSRVVFACPQQLALLESFLHPLMKAAVIEQLRQGGSWVIHGALLEKIGLLAVCDKIIWLDCQLLLRLYRGARRLPRRGLRQLWQIQQRQKLLQPPANSCRIRNNLITVKSLQKRLDRCLRKD